MRISENNDVTAIVFFEVRQTNIRKREFRTAKSLENYDTVFDEEFRDHRLGRNLIKLDNENVQKKDHEDSLNESVNPAENLTDC